MPFGDGTGPFGTFRNCMPIDAAGNPIYAPYRGRFYGRGGFGRGFRWRFLATGTPRWGIFQQPQQTQNLQEMEKQAKESEISFLEQELEAIKKRLEELRKQE